LKIFSIRYQFTQSQSYSLFGLLIKTDHWAMAVNAQWEAVKNLTFAVSSAAGATLWGQQSKSAFIPHRGPFLGKYTGMNYTRSAASYDYYVVFSGQCTISSNQSGCRSNPLHPPHRLTPPPGYFDKSSFGPTVPDPPYLTGLPRCSSSRRRLGG
jgi:hypothetical protein